MSRAYLNEQVDQLVNDINVKRKRDNELIEGEIWAWQAININM